MSPAADGIDAVETPMGVAVLSANPDDGPLQVRGVALSENDVTYGASGDPKFWPREVIEPSVEGLVGTKIVDDSEHEIPEGVDVEDLPQQPSVDAIVGEVTDAKYEPGVGVVYEGEIDDPDVAGLVENGRVDVSPFVFHQAAESEDDDIKQVVNIAHWRDLAVVSEGAGSQASIDPVENGPETADEPVSPTDTQPQSTAAAMSAAALTAVLDTSFDDSVNDTQSEETEVDPADAETEAETEPESEAEANADGEGAEADADGEDDADALSEADVDETTEAAALASFNHLSYDGTKGGKLDESSIPSDSFKSHYLFPGDTKSDSSFPVIDANNNLRRGNVDSAWDLRGQAPSSKEDIEQVLVTLAKKFDDPPVTREDAEALQSNEPAATATAGSSSGVDADTAAEVDAESDADSNTIDMDLTEEEEKFVNKARALDNPTVVEADVEALADEAEDLEIDQVEEPEVIDGAEFDEPKVVESNEYDDLSERVELIEDFMAQRLAERTGMKEETASALSLGAMFKEFEDEDGEFDAEALVQDPVSGDSGKGTSSPDEEDAEALKQNKEEQEEIEMELEALREKRDVLGNTSIAPRLDEQIEALEQKTEGI